MYLRNSRPAYVHSTAVLACKFQMTAKQHRVKGGETVYTLSDEAVNVIKLPSKKRRVTFRMAKYMESSTDCPLTLYMDK